MQTEKQIETQIIDFIRYCGGWVQKVHSGAMLKGYTRKDGNSRLYKMKLADRGTPDLICCMKGRMIAIEVKRDQKEVDKWDRLKETDARSIAQHEQQALIREAGGITIVACSVEEVERDLEELKIL